MMPRFLATEHARVAKPSSGNYPFKDVYGAVEEENVYINMEAVRDLTSKMTAQRDLYLLADISGSMKDRYRTSGFLKKQPSEMHKMLNRIVSMIAPFDDDGIDVIFFSDGIVHKATVANEDDVARELNVAINEPYAFYSTQPIEGFKWIAQQIKAKNRPGTVFFLTDGQLDDKGKALVEFYETVLHTEFRTRDWFYCYAIEFGHDARGALDVLDGKFQPEQGPEDLFDKEYADNIDAITATLHQVGAMTAIGSDDTLSASVTSPALIEMVNADLLPTPDTHIEGPVNQVMSFRVKSTVPFDLTIRMRGYDDMVIHCKPTNDDVEISVG